MIINARPWKLCLRQGFTGILLIMLTRTIFICALHSQLCVWHVLFVTLFCLLIKYVGCNSVQSLCSSMKDKLQLKCGIFFFFQAINNVNQVKRLKYNWERLWFSGLWTNFQNKSFFWRGTLQIPWNYVNVYGYEWKNTKCFSFLYLQNIRHNQFKWRYWKFYFKKTLFCCCVYHVYVQ